MTKIKLFNKSTLAGSANGLMPDGTKPLHESTLSIYDWGYVAFTRELISRPVLKLLFCVMSFDF